MAPSRRSALAAAALTAALAAAQAPNAFQPSGTILVLRGGTGTSTATDTTSVPLFIDELNVDGSGIRSTIALPTAASGANFRCVLTAYTAAAAEEGTISLTTDGAAVLIPCHDGALSVSLPSATTARVIGAVFPNGTVDTRTRLTAIAYGGNARATVRHVVGPNITHLYYSAYQTGAGLTMHTGYIPGGLGGATSINITTNAAFIRGMAIAADPVTGAQRLYMATVSGGASGVGILAHNSSGLPTAPQMSSTSIPVALLPGFNAMQTNGALNRAPWSILPESPTRIWATDDVALAARNLIAYNYAGGVWTLAPLNVSLGTAPLRGLAGRVEGGQFIIYANNRTALWRYNTATGARSIVWFAPTGTTAASYYGVSVPPYDANLAPPSATPTATPTQSSTATPTSTPSTTATNTGTASNTATVTATSSSAPSLTASPSSSLSPGASPSATQTPISSHPARIRISNTGGSCLTFLELMVFDAAGRLISTPAAGATTSSSSVGMTGQEDAQAIDGCWDQAATPMGAPAAPCGYVNTSCVGAQWVEVALPRPYVPLSFINYVNHWARSNVDRRVHTLQVLREDGVVLRTAPLNWSSVAQVIVANATLPPPAFPVGTTDPVAVGADSTLVRYVRINGTATQHLHFKEFLVLDDEDRAVSLFKPATVSGEYNTAGQRFYSWMGVDGVIDTDINPVGANLFHGTAAANAWFHLDLQVREPARPAAESLSAPRACCFLVPSTPPPPPPRATPS